MAQIKTSFIDNLHFNEDDLIPAIAQDWLDGTVLMMAWMNKEALKKTIVSEEVHYWSRSRNEIWHKGATSGHFQKLKGIRYDCDADVLLLTIKQVGKISCHKGARSCFFNEPLSKTGKDSLNNCPPADVCSELFNVIEGRKSTPQKGSYTNALFNGGDNSILKKLGEETAEFIMACKDEDKDSISNEAADIIFHLQVALAHKGVQWEEVLEILNKRRGAPRRA